jgi:hypothetical protein
LQEVYYYEVTKGFSLVRGIKTKNKNKVKNLDPTLNILELTHRGSASANAIAIALYNRYL